MSSLTQHKTPCPAGSPFVAPSLPPSSRRERSCGFKARGARRAPYGPSIPVELTRALAGGYDGGGAFGAAPAAVGGTTRRTILSVILSGRRVGGGVGLSPRVEVA